MAERKTISRRVSTVGWICLLFFAAGFLPTLVSSTPVISMTAAAALIIPFGSRSNRPRQGAIRGAGYGLVAGVGMWSAMSQRTAGAMPVEAGAIVILATAAMCTAVGALFAAMAQRRRQHIDDQWR